MFNCANKVVLFIYQWFITTNYFDKGSPANQNSVSLINVSNGSNDFRPENQVIRNDLNRTTSATLQTQPSGSTGSVITQTQDDLAKNNQTSSNSRIEDLTRSEISSNFGGIN